MYMDKSNTDIDYQEFVSTRISNLRLKKNISARDMSLSLGQSESYINKIENKKALPSMAGFIYICDFFNITPQEFFDVENVDPVSNRDLYAALNKLTPRQREYISALVFDLTKK